MQFLLSVTLIDWLHIPSLAGIIGRGDVGEMELIEQRHLQKPPAASSRMARAPSAMSQ
jgi:hypothetical protein